MTDNKQEPEGWTHAPLIVGWNDDGSLKTVDSWNVKLVTSNEREAFRTALADAIRRPMGVIPESAEGLITQADLDAAEKRRKNMLQKRKNNDTF
jgi:hypothetical protein